MWAAAAAGLTAALLMTAALERLRSSRLIRFDMLLLMGTVFSPPGPRARLFGLAWQAMGGVAFGAIYATLMEFLRLSPGLGTGAAFGLAHGLLSGLSLTTIPFRNRRVALGEVAHPGPFALNFGYADAAALVGSHILFGAAFGLLYAWLAAL
jgi:hypothetical protein